MRDSHELKSIPYPYNLMEMVRDTYTAEQGAEVINSFDYTPKNIRAMVSESLSERECQVIEQRYRDGMTLEEVAKAHNVTRERIRQIEVKALRKLAHPNRLKKYASVSYRDWCAEREAHIKAEERLDWFLQHGEYRVETESKDVVKAASATIKVEDMGLSVRSYNCLKRAGIDTAEQISAIGYDDALKIRNLGKRSLDEVIQKMHLLGLKMKWEKDNAE